VVRWWLMMYPLYCPLCTVYLGPDDAPPKAFGSLGSGLTSSAMRVKRQGVEKAEQH
jgi:hypothetical protein